MTLPSDPFMLLSMINMRLRDDNISLEEFCKSAGVERSEIESGLAAAGFEYMPEVNQFR